MLIHLDQELAEHLDQMQKHHNHISYKMDGMVAVGMIQVVKIYVLQWLELLMILLRIKLWLILIQLAYNLIQE